jgi:hypothetical protein
MLGTTYSRVRPKSTYSNFLNKENAINNPVKRGAPFKGDIKTKYKPPITKKVDEQKDTVVSTPSLLATKHTRKHNV